VLADLGRDGEALAEANQEEARWSNLTARTYVHRAAGRTVDADECLRQLENEWSVDSAYQIAALHVQQGDLDTAFAWFDRAITQRDAGLALVQSEPMMFTIHEDPRWAALLKKIGFTS
jgi:hypothetical protein